MVLFYLLGFSSNKCLDLSVGQLSSPVLSQSFHNPTIDNHKELLTAIFIVTTIANGFLYSFDHSNLTPATATAVSVSFGTCSPLRYNAMFAAILCIFSIAYHACVARSVHSGGWMGKPFKSKRKALEDPSGHYPATLHAQSLDVNAEEARINVADTSLPIPSNFLSACKGNRGNAAIMFRKMLAWRKQNAVDSILHTPQSSQEVFHAILEHYPHFIHGVARDGSSVVYEILGRANPTRLKEAGVSMDQLVWHFVVRNETVFSQQRSRVDPSQVGRMMTVLDVGGIGLGSVTSDVISFIARSSEIMDNYYPEQVVRLVICNTPRWFSSIWMVIARVLPESVKKKVDILQDMAGLDKYIHPSQRPQVYGGTGLNLGQAEEHRSFLQLAHAWKDFGNRDLSQSVVDEGIAGEGIGKVSRPVNQSSNEVVPAQKGFFGWFSSQKRLQPAFLGETNKYKYNNATMRWDLDLGDLIADGPLAGGEVNTHVQSTERASKMLVVDELEEHQLVLAIQAAHLASGHESVHVANSNSLSTFNHLPSANASENATAAQLAGTPRRRTSGPAKIPHNFPSTTETHLNAEPSKTSSNIFLIVSGVYILCSLIQSVCMTLLPVWLVSSPASGGMGYDVKDLALSISGAAVVILNAQVFLQPRLELMLRASAVRTLRIGCGMLIIALLLLPPYAHLFSSAAQPLSTGSVASSTDGRAVDRKMLKNVHISLAEMLSPRVEVDRSLVSVQAVAIMLAATICASHVCRKAASVLLHVTLTSSFSSPTIIRLFISGICNISGSTLATLMYAAVYSLHLRHPMNSCFFIYCSVCTILAVYICSIALVVHFRGDYGVMSDSQMQPIFDGGRYQEEVRPRGATVRKGHGRHQGNSNSSSSSNISTMGTTSTPPSVFGWCEKLPCNLCAVPFDDLTLLSSHLTAGYGSKLYNMKDDFKDL